MPKICVIILAEQVRWEQRPPSFPSVLTYYELTYYKRLRGKHSRGFYLDDLPEMPENPEWVEKGDTSIDTTFS
jgi:hypothetical protein